jgi:hypothetical protein
MERKQIAVLFRGHHHYTSMPSNRRVGAVPNKHIAPTSFDFRKVLPHIQAIVMAPLKSRGDVAVFVSTYVSDHETQTDLEEALAPRRLVYHDNDASLNQCDILANGLQLILDESVAYDEVWVVRFDVMYKAPMSSWPKVFDAEGVVLPFGCLETKLLSDVVIVVRGSWYLLAKIFAATTALAKRGSVDLHGVGELYDRTHIPYTTMYTQRYCSNTAVGVNPLYVLYGRKYDGDDAPPGFQSV